MAIIISVILITGEFPEYAYNFLKLAENIALGLFP